VQTNGLPTFKHTTHNHAMLKHRHFNTRQINTRTYNTRTYKHTADKHSAIFDKIFKIGFGKLMNPNCLIKVKVRKVIGAINELLHANTGVRLQLNRD
jgi:hypothetical protein